MGGAPFADQLDDSLQLIARDAEGSMRDAQSKLDQVLAERARAVVAARLRPTPVVPLELPAGEAAAPAASGSRRISGRVDVIAVVKSILGKRAVLECCEELPVVHELRSRSLWLSPALRSSL